MMELVLIILGIMGFITLAGKSWGCITLVIVAFIGFSFPPLLIPSMVVVVYGLFNRDKK